MSMFNPTPKEEWRYSIHVSRLWFIWIWTFECHAMPIFGASGLSWSRKAALAKVTKHFHRARNYERRN